MAVCKIHERRSGKSFFSFDQILRLSTRAYPLTFHRLQALNPFIVSTLYLAVVETRPLMRSDLQPLAAINVDRLCLSVVLGRIQAQRGLGPLSTSSSHRCSRLLSVMATAALSALGYAGFGFLARCYALGIQKRNIFDSMSSIILRN